MAINLGDALLYLGADDDKLKRDLDGAQDKTKGWGATMQGVLMGVGMGIANAVGGVISGAMDTIGESITLASDLGETQSKVRTLFGESAVAIEQWASSAAANLGLTKQAALDSVGTIGNLFLQLGEDATVTAGISQNLVQLASDLGSFHNADPTDILDSMSAAFRGEYDALQKYVPMINAANVEQRALADTGKESAKELTALDKATAAYALTIEGAGAATGDFSRTSDGWANTMRTLNAYWTEFKTLMGEILLPILTPFIAKLKDLATQALPAIADYIHLNLIPAIEAWAENFDSWWADHGQPFIDDVTQAWEDIKTEAAAAMGATEEQFGFNLESMEALATVVGKRIGTAIGEALGEGLQEWWDTNSQAMWENFFAPPEIFEGGLIDKVRDWFTGNGGSPAMSGPQAQSAPGAPVNGEPQISYTTHIPIVINAPGGNPDAVAQAANQGVTQALRAAGVNP